MIKHDPDLKNYFDTNPVRPRSAYDFGAKAPKKGPKALVNKSDAMNDLMLTCAAIAEK